MNAKQYDELEFTDDFMFGQVLRNNPPILRDLTELITGRKIREIVEPPLIQKTEEFLSSGRGVRFDVYFEDDDTMYDIEMQTTPQKDLNKRTRYYRSLMDEAHLKRNEPYGMLPDEYVIFICMNDPFERGIPLYTFENMCRELPDL